MFYTYLFKDPKHNVWRYVGKGQDRRAKNHFRKSTNPQLGAMLKKRLNEGFEVRPLIIEAEDETLAFEMEELLIEMIGREDLQTGTLFNKTSGGDGVAGRVVTDDQRKSISSSTKLAMNAMTSEARRKMAENQSKAKMKPCTVDGVTIYKNKTALRNALGQGKSGAKSPTFRFV